jgi:hypothetical protein
MSSVTRFRFVGDRNPDSTRTDYLHREAGGVRNPPTIRVEEIERPHRKQNDWKSKWMGGWIGNGGSYQTLGWSRNIAALCGQIIDLQRIII